MIKKDRYIKYYTFIEKWLQNNQLNSTSLFAVLEAAEVPYGVLVTDSNFKTPQGKAQYIVLKNSIIPIKSNVANRENSINTLLKDNVIIKQANCYKFVKNSDYMTIGKTRKLVNTTDGRWPLPLFSTEEMGINTKFKFKKPLNTVNKTYYLNNIKLQIIQGIFVINNTVVKNRFEDVEDYILNSLGIQVSPDNFINNSGSLTEELFINEKVKEAYHSDKADDLSEKAVLKLRENIDSIIAYKLHEFSNELHSLSDERLAEFNKLVYNAINEQKNDLTYKPLKHTPYTSNTMQYNKSKLSESLNLLDSMHTVYVTGLAGSGKTFMCKEIAGRYCNINTNLLGQDTACFDNLLWVNCPQHTVSDFRKLFASFCKHTKDMEKPLVVFNEADKKSFSTLFPKWEQMDADGKTFKEFKNEKLTFDYNGIEIEIPRGLRILANIENNQYDIQMERRFHNRVNLDDINLNDLDDVAIYTGINANIIRILVDLQNKLYEAYNLNDDIFISIYKLKVEPKTVFDKALIKVNNVIGSEWQSSKQILRAYAIRQGWVNINEI